MNAIEDLIDKLEEINESIGDIIRVTLQQHREEIIDLVHSQLADGKRSDGKDIRPYYSEDSYFATPREAQGYIAWKQTTSRSTTRNPDAPNLFINGKFYSELEAVFTDREMLIRGATPYADDIVDKYGLPTFGLNDDNIYWLSREYIWAAILTYTKKVIYS